MVVGSRQTPLPISRHEKLTREKIIMYSYIRCTDRCLPLLPEQANPCPGPQHPRPSHTFVQNGPSKRTVAPYPSTSASWRVARHFRQRPSLSATWMTVVNVGPVSLIAQSGRASSPPLWVLPQGPGDLGLMQLVWAIRIPWPMCSGAPSR